MKLNLILVAGLIFGIFSCQQAEQVSLPIYGPRSLNENGTDTVFYSIPAFSFTDQDQQTITQQNFEGKIYVADFFFTSCRTICPVMKKEMVRVQEAFAGNQEVGLLSHTLDPNTDTPEKLNAYASALGADTQQWKFVTGTIDEVYDMAEKGYFQAALMDDNQPDGITHSGRLVLVDKQKHIRGFYEGTDPDEVDRLIKDMHTLLKE